MRGTAVLILCGALLRSAWAQAEEPRRFTLDYHGAATCPTEVELLAEIARRAPTAEHVTSGPHEVSARLRIESDGEVQRASIDIEGRDGATHRDIEARGCAQVAHASALILAIAVDPDAAATAREPASPAAPPKLNAAPSRGTPPPASATIPLWWAAGLGVGLTGGVAPSPAFNQALFFELGRGRGSGLSANARLTGLHAHGAVEARAGNADFDLLALRLASCPYRIGARFALSGCASFDFGRLQGRGSRTRAEHTSSARWFGPGAFADAELAVLPWLRVQLELGALVPLSRDSFYFGPSETVQRIPALAGYGGLNLRVGG